MVTKLSTVEWFDVSPKAYSGVTFEDLTKRFRSNSVAALVTHLDMLDITVINLLSPIGYIFCGALKNYKLYWHSSESAGIHWGQDQERCRTYTKELRHARVKKRSPQAKLFGGIEEECGNRSKTVLSLSSDPQYLEFYRLQSYSFERRFVEAVRKNTQDWFEQLGQWAFISFHENIQVGDFFPGEYSFDYWVMNWRFPTFGLFEQTESDLMGEKVLAELKRSVARLESGLEFDLDEAPTCQIKRPAKLTCRDIYAQKLTAEVISYRCRLIRVRAHPGYFESVERQLPELRKDWINLGKGKSFPYDPVYVKGDGGIKI